MSVRAWFAEAGFAMRKIPKRLRRQLSVGLVCAALALPAFAQAAPSDGGTKASADSTPGNPPPHPARRIRGVTLDERVRGLSKALDLDAAQQQQLKEVLENERNEIRSFAASTSIRAEDRIGTLRAISDTTVQRIRALLNDEQKKKYYPAGPPAAPGTGPNADKDLNQWLNALVKPPANQQ